MNIGLSLDIVVDTNEILYGESCPFMITLINGDDNAVEVPTFDPYNQSLSVVLTDDNGTEHTADQFSEAKRDGLDVYNPPRDLPKTTLSPGQRMQLAGDLLAWFGYIAPGRYSVEARFTGSLFFVTSDKTHLTVSPATITQASAPRSGKQAPSTPMACAWAHRHGEDCMLMYAMQSPFVSRNPRLCIRTALAPMDVTLKAACLNSPRQPFGHLYWFDNQNRFAFARIDLKNKLTDQPAMLKSMPGSGGPLESALSMNDGSMLLPFADEKSISLIHVMPDGGTEKYRLELGRNAPLGPYVCYWQLDQRLHFAWTKPRGRQIDYAMIPLDDLKAGFATRTMSISNDPVIWLDAFQRQGLSAAELGSLYLGGGDTEEPVDPLPAEPVIWCVSEQPGRYLCTALGVNGGMAAETVTLRAGGASGLRVISSAVGAGNGLSLLMADPADRLFYGSTLRKSIQPLENITGVPVRLTDDPVLMKSGDSAAEPWVHLRYLMSHTEFAFARLEPEMEPDPTEKENFEWEYIPDEDVDDDAD